MTTYETIQELKAKEPSFGYTKLAKTLGLSVDLVKYHLKKNRKDTRVQRRQNFLTKVKSDLGGRCCICDYCRDFGALEFHHVSPDDKDLECEGPSRVLASKGQAAFLKEIETCILVCSNCHREIHSGVILCQLS